MKKDVPEFIKQSERLHKIWLEKWEEFMQYSFDIKDVNNKFKLNL